MKSNPSQLYQEKKLSPKVIKKAKKCTIDALVNWQARDLKRLFECTMLSWRTKNSILALEDLPFISDFKILNYKFHSAVMFDLIVNLTIGYSTKKYRLRFISEKKAYEPAVKKRFLIFSSKQVPFRFNPISLKRV